jgi:hypothetical protein
MTFGSGIKKMEASLDRRRSIYHDLNDQQTSDEERYFVKHILAFLLLRMGL